LGPSSIANSSAWPDFFVAEEEDPPPRRDLGGYVSQECRGKGVGRALLAELIGLLRLLPGIEQVALAVSSKNAGARGLYESLGFEVYGCEKGALKIGEEYVDEELMVLYFRS
jgi:ribosomal protein S18 acetylase RimI-like enzyme